MIQKHINFVYKFSCPYVLWWLYLPISVIQKKKNLSDTKNGLSFAQNDSRLKVTGIKVDFFYKKINDNIKIMEDGRICTQ